MAITRRDLVRVFDRTQDVSILERRLPHWSQSGTLCFITFRTWDSMPETVVKSWLQERDQFLLEHGLSPTAPNWREQLQELAPQLVDKFHELLSDRWNQQLDACYGSCVLRRPELARLVADSLNHFDGQRYILTDFVVMPNHVHVLSAFPDDAAMMKQCESWKHFSAHAINRRLGRSGRFWQQDGFDHLVRSSEQFDQLRHYIAQNSIKAHLRSGEYYHESKDLSESIHHAPP